MKKLIIAITAIASLLLTNCATIVGKSEYDVNIQNNIPKSSFKVRNINNEIVGQGTTGTVAHLKSSNGFFKGASYRVEVAKGAKLLHTQTLDSTVNPWVIGNLFNFTGFVGLAIDGATGKMYKLPDHYEINQR